CGVDPVVRFEERRRLPGPDGRRTAEEQEEERDDGPATRDAPPAVAAPGPRPRPASPSLPIVTCPPVSAAHSPSSTAPVVLPPAVRAGLSAEACRSRSAASLDGNAPGRPSPTGRPRGPAAAGRPEPAPAPGLRPGPELPPRTRAQPCRRVGTPRGGGRSSRPRRAAPFAPPAQGSSAAMPEPGPMSDEHGPGRGALALRRRACGTGSRRYS